MFLSVTVFVLCSAAHRAPHARGPVLARGPETCARERGDFAKPRGHRSNSIAHNTTDRAEAERSSVARGAVMGAETFVCSAFVRELYSTALAPREGFACAASFVGLPQPHAPHTERALRSLSSPTPPTPPHLLNPIQPCSPLAT